MKSFTYRNESVKPISDLVNKLNNYFVLRNMEVQILTPIDTNTTIIQAKKSNNSMRNIVGQALASTVMINPKENTVTVDIGCGRWLDKSILTTISLFVFWWLAIPAGIGFYRQDKIMKDARKIADQWFELHNENKTEGECE